MHLLTTAASVLKLQILFFDCDVWPIAGLCCEALMWHESDSIQTGQ